MKPGSKEGGVILRDDHEIYESGEALMVVGSELADRLINDAIAPYEMDLETVVKVLRGLRIILARDGLSPDYRQKLMALRADLVVNSISSIEGLQGPFSTE